MEAYTKSSYTAYSYSATQNLIPLIYRYLLNSAFYSTIVSIYYRFLYMNTVLLTLHHHISKGIYQNTNTQIFLIIENRDTKEHNFRYTYCTKYKGFNKILLNQLTIYIYLSIGLNHINPRLERELSNNIITLKIV